MLKYCSRVAPAFEGVRGSKKEQEERNVKVSHKEGGEVVSMHNKAAGYQEPEISSTFLKNAILCYVSQILDNNKRVQDTFPQ